MTDVTLIIDGQAYDCVPQETVGVPVPPPQVSSVDRWTQALLDLEDTRTSGAWGRSNGGILASKNEVDYNLRFLMSEEWISENEYVARVEVAKDSGIPTSVLMAIYDRESNHGRALDSRGYGDHGNGFGVGQVDGRYHQQQGKPDPLSIAHMRQSAGIFKQYLSDVESKHPTWADKYILKGATVAYNSGVGNVATIDKMDKGTTGGDYGADTLARAKYYHALGYDGHDA